MDSHSPAKHSVFPVIATVLAVTAAVAPMPVWAGVPIALAFFALNGAAWGRKMVSEEHVVWRVFLGTLAVLAATIALGGGIYYLSALNATMTALTLALVGGATPLILLVPGPKKSVFHALGEAVTATAQSLHLTAKPRIGRLIASIALSGIAAALAYFAATLLMGAATGDSIRSPWDAAPQMFFVALFMAAVGTAASPWIAKDSPAPIAAYAAFAAMATSVATLSYKIGFGFDPFIHQATERAIMAYGAVDPKPLYYLGHYALTIVLARVTDLSVNGIDAWMVPVMFALTVPCAFWAVRRAFDVSSSAAAFASGTTLLLLPLSPFIPSTPQGHANAWFLMTAFLALPALVERRFPKRALALFAVAASAIHPLAGIPLLILVGFVFVTTLFARKKGSSDAGRLLLMGELVLFGSMALPLVFVLQSIMAGGGARIDLETLRSPARILEAVVPAADEARRYIVALDVAYAWRSSRTMAFVAAAILGIALARRRSRSITPFAATAVVLFVNYVLLKSVIDFPFLISYERGAYADRIADLALFALAAPAAVALAIAAERAHRSSPAVRLAVPLLAAVAMTSSVYLAYPRRDRYENSRGWSTGTQDVATVQAIEKDANGTPYVVLANQATSAAAIREFGFRTYYDSKDPAHTDPVFFYPIPTGGALYELFLGMNADGGDLATAKKAMDLAGVDTAYFAVSHYWWDARKITLAARKRADKSWIVDEKVYVFKYVRK